MEFKDIVKNRREELGLTMEELGKRVGVSKATVQRWESGEISNVRRDKISKLAIALNSSPSYLMGWDEEPKPKGLFTKVKSMTHTVPVYGRIPAGTPFEAIEERLEDVAVPDKVARKSDVFGLKIVGDSMNKELPNGAIGVFQRSCEVNQGDIAAVMVNGDDATVKHFTKTLTGCILEPNSYNPEHEPIFITEGKTEVSIIGKLVWYCMDPNDIK